MALVNYCRKCKAETPLGECCPYCGGKLAQTGEQCSFGVVRSPVRDWFCWNQYLRVALPALLLALIISLAAEALAQGAAGALALLERGLLWTFLILLCVTLLLILLLLLLQGPERVHYVMDKQGVWARTYLTDASPLRLYARFLSPQAVERLQDDRPALENLALVRRVFLPWSQVRRVRIWREGYTLLFFHPACWQAVSMRCPPSEMEQAEAYARKKLKRFPKSTICYTNMK